MLRRGKIRVCIDLDPSTVARLAEKYGDVTLILVQAARQLAEAPESEIHSISRYIELWTLLDQLSSAVKDIVSDIKYMVHSIPPQSQLERIWRHIITAKWAVVNQALKKLKKITPPAYKRQVKQLEDELIKWIVTIKHSGDSGADA